MPVLAKILSEEEQKNLQLAQVEDIQPEFIHDLGDQNELEEVMFRIFKPHAYTARQEYEAKKNERLNRNKWLEVIVNNQVSLQNTQTKLKQHIAAQKTQISAR